MNILQRIRNAAGITQKVVASDLGVNQGHVSRWESGKSNVPLHAIEYYFNLKPRVTRADVDMAEDYGTLVGVIRGLIMQSNVGITEETRQDLREQLDRIEARRRERNGR